MNRWTALVTLLFLWSANAHGTEENANPARAQLFKEMHKKDFADWGGLAFFCSPSHEDETTKALCEWAGQRFRLLAKPLNIPVVIVTATDRVHQRLEMIRSNVPDLLDVELVMFSNASPPRGLYVAVKVGSYYTGAVEDPMSPYRSQPAKNPKPGTLVLWERGFLGTGTSGPDFDSAVRLALDPILMEFLSDFADGR